MKTSIKNPFLLSMLITVLGLILAGRATAQTFTVLHNFTALSGPYPGTNSDGTHPISELVLSGNTLYGTANTGGSCASCGTVFAVNTDGTGFTNLHSFTGSDGAKPAAGLTLSGNTLYGTTQTGGSFSSGTVFALNTDGTGFTNVYSFTARSGASLTNSDGAWPIGGLVLAGNRLYGTALTGGSFGIGAVFAVNTDGTAFTNLHSCSSSGGGSPSAGLIIANNTLYGTAEFGGSFGHGTVFAINTDGGGFTNLHSFDKLGGEPLSRLSLSSNTLYGTIQNGGSSDSGTVFAINTDGTGFTNLLSFSASGSDGAFPYAGVVLSGNTLYGTTYRGGSLPSLAGTVFAVNTDGTGFQKLHNFTQTFGPLGTNVDGNLPTASVILSGNTLYGTAKNGGISGSGTVFSIFIQPQLTIAPSGQSVILTWPTNYADFTLQSTTNLATPVWVTNSQVPSIVNGQNTITNPISGIQQFYRLSP
jgi:uncharacterized repeat protein (TIGR03803 family)